MITKKILVPDRVRKINGGFSLIPRRFLRDRFLEHLSQPELAAATFDDRLAPSTEDYLIDSLYSDEV